VVTLLVCLTGVVGSIPITCSIQPASTEATTQAKCCGDMPVPHTGVVGFNSHRLLDPSRLLGGLPRG
jgi:hypothetical protein